MKISIAIPTWECYGRGSEYLNDLLRTIQIQSHKDFEVCISDHSVNDEVLEEVKQFENKFNIVYDKNENDRGNGPANTNKVIDMCSGEIIKIMFQDDFFYDDEALEKIHGEFENSDKMWLVSGCNHTNDDGHNFYWEMYPKWNDRLIEGVNTISSPSVVAARSEVFDSVEFDENLVMMMDCDFYFNCDNKFGSPIFLNDVLVSNRVHSNQISQQYQQSSYQEKMSKEVNYCREKYAKISCS